MAVKYQFSSTQEMAQHFEDMAAKEDAKVDTLRKASDQDTAKVKAAAFRECKDVALNTTISAAAR